MRVLLFLGLFGPLPGPFRSKAEVRDLECERVGPYEIERDRPGAVRPVGPRGQGALREVVVCRERVLRTGVRAPDEEAVLTTLDDTASSIAIAVASLRPDLRDRTWLVEAHHTSPAVGTKIAFAAKNALVAQGLSVSDRLPLLSAADVQVVTRMAPDDAWATACRRWSDTGGLRPGDALLAVVLRDARATGLHAGVCDGGRWSWLR